MATPRTPQKFDFKNRKFSRIFSANLQLKSQWEIEELVGGTLRIFEIQNFRKTRLIFPKAQTLGFGAVFDALFIKVGRIF